MRQPEIGLDCLMCADSGPPRTDWRGAWQFGSKWTRSLSSSINAPIRKDLDSIAKQMSQVRSREMKGIYQENSKWLPRCGSVKQVPDFFSKKLCQKDVRQLAFTHPQGPCVNHEADVLGSYSNSSEDIRKIRYCAKFRVLMPFPDLF